MFSKTHIFSPKNEAYFRSSVFNKINSLNDLFLNRKLLPDLARSLVITAIDPVFPTHKLHSRGYNGFHKV